ncbi:Golgi-associated plant pathogenesis-related protein 1-like isoform X1 [Myxocyprinus asiaticus]|uniref:Golgi-associated plant pathogenesis-related protein 1-like isoform X1 n=1 Tax=Myxocyprinus asiaticus TaxID=70543 RepID=UPI0022231CC0|nr:Golgi-associated plant pathogenesis-related protein 1-like isoform X1 [Myxocyprinus asiaticus]
MGKSASRLFCEEVLKTHNEYRRKHEAPPLKLSNKLSHEAARYAESLASTRILKHSAESSRGNCGENLAWASYDQTGKDVSDRWYNEVNQYNFNQPGFSSATVSWGERHINSHATVRSRERTTRQSSVGVCPECQKAACLLRCLCLWRVFVIGEAI